MTCVALWWKPGQILAIDSVCESLQGACLRGEDTVTVICHSPVKGDCPGFLNVASAVAQSDVWLSVSKGWLAGELAVVELPRCF